MMSFLLLVLSSSFEIQNLNDRFREGFGNAVISTSTRKGYLVGGRR